MPEYNTFPVAQSIRSYPHAIEGGFTAALLQALRPKSKIAVPKYAVLPLHNFPLGFIHPDQVPVGGRLVNRPALFRTSSRKFIE